MAILTIPDALRTLLSGLLDHTELRDEAGNPLGMFTPRKLPMMSSTSGPPAPLIWPRRNGGSKSFWRRAKKATHPRKFSRNSTRWRGVNAVPSNLASPGFARIAPDMEGCSE